MTNLMESTVGDIAAQSLRAVKLFEQLGIDYCCGGKRSLAEACGDKGIDPAKVGNALAEPAASPDTDWRNASLRDLIRHIVRTHHEFLKLELPRLNERMRKVVAAHMDKDPRTIQALAGTLGALSEELHMHLQKEETILFPAIERMASGGPMGQTCFGSVANPIAMMEHEHDSAGAALAAIRRLTNNFTVPEWACNTARALWLGLEELEADLHMHIHLENNVLHPRAIALERQSA